MRDFSWKNAVRTGRRMLRPAPWVIAVCTVFSAAALTAVFKLAAGWYYGSVWFMAVAVYYIVLAVMNLFRVRRQASPVQAAARALTLAGALMAIFALQTGMIARFGTGDELFRLVMNALTGGAVCIAVLVMGVLMAVYGGRMIRRTDP